MTDKQIAAERSDFETAVRQLFQCSDHTFTHAYPYGYYNAVWREPGECASVGMLWSIWQARSAMKGKS